MKQFFIFILLTALCLWGQSVPGTISTFAGNGKAPFTGDGKKATEVQLYDIFQIAFDGANNLYVADYYYDRVFKIAPNGILTTLAGNDQFGFSGDGLKGTAASLYGPRSLAASVDGTVFIGDVLNARIRKVLPNGIISTAAGGGSEPRDSIPATSSILPCPESIAYSKAGYLGIVTQCDHYIRVVYPNGVIYTMAGNGRTTGTFTDGAPGYTVPLGLTMNGLATDESGNFFFSADNHIRKINFNGFTVSTVAGGDKAGFAGDGGPATSALFNTPHRLTLDKIGNILVPDKFNHRIRKIDTKGVVNTIAGNGTAAYAGENVAAAASSIALPSSVAVDSTSIIYFAEQGARRIRKILPNGQMVTVAGIGIPTLGDGGPVASSLVIDPYGLAVAPDGTVYISDNNDHRIRRVSPDGIINTFAGTGVPGYSGDNGPAALAQFNGPRAVALDANGNVFVSDSDNNAVRMITPDGTISTVAGTGVAGSGGDLGPASQAQLQSPAGLGFDSSGNLYIADFGNNRLRMVDLNGMITTLAGDGTAVDAIDGAPATASSLASPADVAFDGNGNVIVSSFGTARIRMVAPDGTMTTIAGGGSATLADGTSELTSPYGLAFDGQGALFITERTGRLKMLVNGTLSLVVGHAGKFEGDNGPALDGWINNPRHLAFLPDGSLLVADAANKRIRKVSFVAPAANKR